MALKIAAITGSRADWGLMSPVLKLMRDDPHFDLRLIVTGQHIPAKTDEAIRDQGFIIHKTLDIGLDGDDTAAAITRALGREIMALSDAFNEMEPDLLLLTGDRYEMLGAAQAALIAQIPMAHMFGGDVTEGAIDDSIRHAITKLSHIHLVTNIEAQKRVIQMGENPANVHLVGSPSLDHIHTVRQMDRQEFFEAISFAPREKNYLITFHPITQAANSLEQCAEMLAALEGLGNKAGLIFTGSNADPQGVRITGMIKAFVNKHENACYHESLGTELYLNALRHVDAVVGNSSSGLYEAPSFGTWTINIGDRQEGRLKAASVIDCLPDREAIMKAVLKLKDKKPKNVKNPYGDGHSAERIINTLKNIDNIKGLHKKKFHERGEHA